MFEKIKRIFAREPVYTSLRTRVHKKQIAKSGHYWLVVNCDNCTNAIQIPRGVSDEQIKEVEKLLVKQILERKR